MFGKYCPTPKAEGNISQTQGKQFPIVTDNNSLYLFCYTSWQYEQEYVLWNAVSVPLLQFAQYCSIVRRLPSLFFLSSPTAKTGGRIFAMYTLNDADSPKDVPFEGLDDEK